MLQSKKISILFVISPLILSIFVHLWNPTGFPALDQDEGHYMRRAMQVIQGLGPQESKDTYFYPYDHPYFGQIFLAAALSLVNYPYSINPSVNPQSIEMLYLVPRVLMGILAVVDTFLVYKIADARYNRKVAFISAILFAVLPYTWFLRKIIIDSIALPLILLSILFAIYYAKSSARDDSGQIRNSNLRYLLILPSGIFLGLAIFTKLPVFTLIPLLIFILLNKNIISSNKDRTRTKSANIKALGIWFLPVILIPMIWLGYAVATGHLQDWLDGVVWQANRADRPFAPEMRTIFVSMDPAILLLGAAGLVYSLIKKDYFILLWSFPYLIFIYLVNWVYYFHIIPVVAVFCIGGTVFLLDVLQKLPNKFVIRLSAFTVFAAIIIFGLVNSTLLVTQNINDSNFRLASFVTSYLPAKQIGNNNSNSSDKLSLIGPNGAFILSWIPSYVFNKNFDFKWFEGRRDYVEPPIPTNHFLMIVDWQMRELFSGNSTKEHIKYVSQLNNSSNLFGVFYNNKAYPDISKYPYTNIRDDVTGEDLHFRGIQWSDKIEVKGNYKNNSFASINR